jgi:anti-anti-sigma regulatory factor
MSIKKIYKGEVVILELDNDLIGYQARIFQEYCTGLISEGVKKLIINLQAVNSIDSLGTSEICKMLEKGMDVRLINVSHGVDLFIKCHAPSLLEKKCVDQEEAISLIYKANDSSNAGRVDKRSSERKMVSFPVLFSYIEPGAGSEEARGVVLNISSGGLLLRLSQAAYFQPVMQKKLSLRFIIPGFAEPVYAEGVINRSIVQDRKRQLGIKFEQIDNQAHDSIVDYVYNRAEQE